MAGARQNLKFRFIEICCHRQVRSRSKNINQNIENQRKSIVNLSKIGVVNMMFKEMGGKLGFVLVLLNKENTGFC